MLAGYDVLIFFIVMSGDLLSLSESRSKFQVTNPIKYTVYTYSQMYYFSTFSLSLAGRFVMSLQTEFRENPTNGLAVDLILQMDGWGLHVLCSFFKLMKTSI